VQLDQRYRFENLVVGSANRLAVAAARAVAEAPGTVYNPLFVYGGSGLGKTHLLGGIGQLVHRLQPSLRVEYVSLVDFVEQYHAAVAAGETDAWAARWQEVNVLLVDDIQFLAGRTETQNELLRLFAALQQNDRQIVLTSDRAPSDIGDVDERLIARLAGGLVVDIGSPDYETRAAILRGVAAEREYDIPAELLDELARIEFSNVRELQGALNRLVAHKSLGNGQLRVDDVARALGLDIPGRPRRSTDDFSTFLADVTSAVQQHVESWKARLSEAVLYWEGEGYKTGVLERALALPKPPNVEGLIETYTQAVEHLKTLEARATAVDPALGGNPAFRDPEKLEEAEDLVERALAGQLPPPGPSPAFARASFEVSTSNMLAVKAADAVIGQPGVRYNPLLLHGPSGVGKTHLAHAIGNEIAARDGARVAVVPSQRFVDELIAAIGAGTVDRWRSRYRAADVLIVDDVQFLAGKDRSQEELFHIFNALHSAGRQLVFTSDLPPRRITGLEDRLRSRFDGGLVVPIDPPDRMLRERIVMRTLDQHAQPTDADLVRIFAEQPVQNVRELVGLVHRLIAVAEARGVALSAPVARGELGPVARPTPTRSSMRVVDSTFLDREKVVWEWPEPAARMIEELR
jgi:chromosomal replication initiator protein DnaA